MWEKKYSYFPVEGVLAGVWRINSFIYQPPGREGGVRQDQDEVGGRMTSWKCFKEEPELGLAQRGWGEGV